MLPIKKSGLIIVPCHSIWKHSLFDHDFLNFGQLSDHWFLAPFQYEGNDHLAFIKHGLKAIHLIADNLSNESLVVFSGSQTKPQAPCISEAQSYYLLMYKLIDEYQKNWKAVSEVFNDDDIINYLQKINSILIRKETTLDELFLNSIATEEFALDSFENLLFSIYRFKQLKHEYPTDITIVGFGFKETRFLDYHAKAIDFPKEHINYVGVDPLPTNYSAQQLDQYYNDLKMLEHRNALKLFAVDWYGSRTSLASKKRSRNPFNRYPGYHNVSLFDLEISFDDDEKFFDNYISGVMPWSTPKNK